MRQGLEILLFNSCFGRNSQEKVVLVELTYLFLYLYINDFNNIKDHPHGYPSIFSFCLDRDLSQVSTYSNGGP